MSRPGSWLHVLALGLLTLLFALINRGLGIFDEISNLPLVSVMAAGDIPPHFFLNPQSLLAYHYGLHVFAAALVRFGGMFPWSAFDLAKALVLALTIILTYVWTLRVTQRLSAAVLGAVAMGIAGGTRWLLLFVPAGVMSSLGSGLQMMGSGLTRGEPRRGSREPVENRRGRVYSIPIPIRIREQPVRTFHTCL